MSEISLPESVPLEPSNATRQWMRRFARVLLIGVLCLMLVLVAAMAIESWRQAREDARFPAPGQLVDVGGYRLHLHCQGKGSPTVVLESGLGMSSTVWAWVQPRLAESTRVCSYDRAGYGWSDSGPAPRSGERLVRDLHTALQKAGETGPLVLVGHSLGGLLVRLYHATYPDDVAGLVLIDPTLTRFRERTIAPEEIEPLSFWHGPSLLARLGYDRIQGPPVAWHTNLPEEVHAALVLQTRRASTWRAAINEQRYLRAYQYMLWRLADEGRESPGTTPVTLIKTTVVADTSGLDPAQVQEILESFTAALAEMAAASNTGEFLQPPETDHLSILVDPEDAEFVVRAVRKLVQGLVNDAKRTFQCPLEPVSAVAS